MCIAHVGTRTLGMLFRGAVICWLGSCFCPTATAEPVTENFLKNPGFEQLDTQAVSGWRPWAEYNRPIVAKSAVLAPDETVAYSGKRSISIKANDSLRYGWEQTIRKERFPEGTSVGCRAVLVGYVKCAGGAKAELALACLGGEQPLNVVSEVVAKEKSGWERHRVTVDIPSDTTYLEIACTLAGTGSAWFDGFSLGLSSAGSAPGTRPENLLKNPDFEESESSPESWKTGSDIQSAFAVDGAVRHGGLRSLRVTGSGCHILSQNVTTFPKGEHVVLSGHVKNSGGFANLWINCFDSQDSRITYVQTNGDQHEGDWIELSTHLEIPRNCARIEVWVYLASAESPATAWFDDLCLRRVRQGESLPRVFAYATMSGPGIACAEGAYEFTGCDDPQPLKVAFPLPAVYAEQAPICVTFATRPADRIQKAVVKKRLADSHNWIAEVEFKSLRPKEKIEFSWKAHVLLTAKDYRELPKVAKIPVLKDIPREALPWLRPTKSVQSDHPDIRGKARELRAPNEDLIETIRRVIAFSSRTSQTPKMGPDRPNDCTALTALHWGEICTGTANLAAALLRANGVPARLLANYPVWNTPFQTHYFIEVYIPGFGWTRAESIMNEFPVETFGNIIVSVVSPEDEDRSLAPARWAAGGCPHLSLTEPECNFEVVPNFAWNGCDHVAFRVARFDDSEEALRQALTLTKDAWNRSAKFRVEGSDPPQGAAEILHKACLAKELNEFVRLVRQR